jgi:hypothetical protein
VEKKKITISKIPEKLKKASKKKTKLKRWKNQNRSSIELLD